VASVRLGHADIGAVKSASGANVSFVNGNVTGRTRRRGLDRKLVNEGPSIPAPRAPFV
jgi:hypothetical protein